MSKRKGKKITFIPGGRVQCWALFLLFLICFLISILFLFDGSIEDAFGYLLCSLGFLCGLLLLIRAKYFEYIVVFSKGIMYKKKMYEWQHIYITIDYKSPSINRDFYAYFAYFSDHYLTQEEIRSKKVKKNVICLGLQSTRLKFFLPLYPKKVKILRENPVQNSENLCILNILKKHNLGCNYEE